MVSVIGLCIVIFYAWREFRRPDWVETYRSLLPSKLKFILWCLLIYYGQMQEMMFLGAFILMMRARRFIAFQNRLYVLFLLDNYTIGQLKLLFQDNVIDVNMYVIELSTILMREIIPPTNKEMINLLLDQKDINVNAKNKNGETALSVAAYWHLETTCRLLMSRGAVPGEELLKRPFFANWKSHLPVFKRHAPTNRYFPSEIRRRGTVFLLCCRRYKIISKDMQYLILEYIFNKWKECGVCL